MHLGSAKEIYLNDTPISSKKCILWGGGQYAQSACKNLQLGDIAHVVDKNPKNFGKTIVLYYQEYTIEDVAILKDLSPEEYVILISSKDFFGEIKEEILMSYPEWGNAYGRIDDIVREYDSLEALIYTDPEIISKLERSKISSCLFELMKRADKLIQSHCCSNGETMLFRPLKASSRAVFSISAGRKRYVMHFPHYGMNVGARSMQAQQQVVECKKRLGINAELVLYEDATGLMLSHYAGQEMVDWNEEVNVKEVMGILRCLHRSGQEMNVARYAPYDIPQRLYRCDSIPLWLHEFYEVILDEVKAYTPCLCHGDAHCGNVVLHQEKVEFIDWSFMSMSDPIYDVCYFLYDLFFVRHCKCLECWEEGLNLYYQRILTDEELRHARAVMIYIVYWKCIMDASAKRDLKDLNLLEAEAKKYRLQKGDTNERN